MAIRKHGLYTIDNKVLQKEHIQKIAKLIWREYDQLQENSINKTFDIYIKCFNKFSYTSDTIDIFDDDSEIYKERIKSIEIVASCDKKLFIKLRLNHGQMLVDEKYITDSDIEIGGSDITKIHDLQMRIDQEIRAIPPQNNIVLNYSRFIVPLVFFISAISFGYAVDFYYGETNLYTPYWRRAFNDFENFIVYNIFPVICGGVLCSMYYTYSKKSLDVWPYVELHIGPDHLRPEIRKRKKIIFFFGVIILPLLLAFIYDLIKATAYALK